MKVSLFATCLIDTFYPDVGASAVRLLRRLGVEVDFPLDQTCCGQPAFNSGYSDAARAAATQLIRAFDQSECVVSPSGSCVAMVRQYYPALFEGHPMAKAAKAFAEKTYELSQFLTEALGVEDLGGSFAGVGTYHSSCHMLRGLGVKDAPKRLLRHVRGFELIDLPAEEECCGFGGTFAVKLAGLSTAMADEKLRRVQSTGARYLVGSDMACLMHMGGRMERQGMAVETIHLAQLLERATREGAGERGAPSQSEEEALSS